MRSSKVRHKLSELWNSARFSAASFSIGHPQRNLQRFYTTSACLRKKSKPEKNRGRDHDIGQRNGENPFPSQLHQLIVAETRQGPAHGHKKPAEKNDFKTERRNLQQSHAPLRQQ